MEIPADRNLTIHQNTTWTQTFSILIDGVAMSFDGYSIAGKCRKGEDSTSTLLFSFTFSISGTAITVSVPASVTAAIDLSLEPDQAQYWYDFVLTDPSGTKTKIQRGRVTLVRTVTT